MPSPNGVNYPMDQRQLAAKTKDALGRLKDLEDTLPQVVGGFQQAVQQLQQNLNGLTEIMDAVIETLGADKITTLMTANRTRKTEAQVANDKAALDQALLNGSVVQAEVVSEKSIVIGRETNADGSVKSPGYVQAPYVRIDAKFQAVLLGQKKGFSFDLPTGGKFEVDAVYDVVENPAPVAAEEAPAVAPETPAS